MVEVVRLQVLGSAEKGVHRALRVGRDKDEAAGGRRLLRPRRRIELDAKRAYVVAEHFAKLIRGDPADEPGPASQRGHARRSLRRRTARRFPARSPAYIDPYRPLDRQGVG